MALKLIYGLPLLTEILRKPPEINEITKHRRNVSESCKGISEVSQKVTENLRDISENCMKYQNSRRTSQNISEILQKIFAGKRTHPNAEKKQWLRRYLEANSVKLEVGGAQRNSK